MLDPDMPTQELKLHMGELTANEVRVARAAIRWANSQMPQWQPIETAPHDTRVILAHWDDYRDKWIIEADFASQGRVGRRSWHSHATHWMPLPEPPK